MSEVTKAPARALSIRQPFVELILQGKKKFEYRSTACNIRERVYLYASLKDNSHPPSWRKIKSDPKTLPRGLIVGTVAIVGCTWDKRYKCFAWHLAKPSRLKKHLAVSNQPTPKFWFPRFNRR